MRRWLTRCLTAGLLLAHPADAAFASRGAAEPRDPQSTVIAHEGTVGSLIVGPAGQVGGSGSGGDDGCRWELADFSGTPTGNSEADESGVMYRNHPTDGRRQVAIQKV